MYSYPSISVTTDLGVSAANVNKARRAAIEKMTLELKAFCSSLKVKDAVE